ncbi:MAG TPA: ZTL protein [Kiritimatiellia bacterium]|nr:ZTL protein [Kiritimatiellia bacterium]
MATPALYVLAGVNGSGRSSIGGAKMESQGVEYYNPDRVARKLRDMHPTMTPGVANSHTWMLGKELLEQSIARKDVYAFETTLGGHTITNLLISGATAGMQVKIWYVGLESVERNIARVRARVERGGHDIPVADIRKRWDSSRRNLIALLPQLHSLRLYDNSHEADPHEGKPPRPQLLLHVEARKIVEPNGLSRAPEWAKPIIAGALNTYKAS